MSLSRTTRRAASPNKRTGWSLSPGSHAKHKVTWERCVRCWHVAQQPPKQPPPDTERVTSANWRPIQKPSILSPSWTWAARNGIVDFPTPELDDSDSDSELQLSPALSALDLRSKATILDIDIALASPDSFGWVTAGRLTLSSHWCTVRLEATPLAATHVRRRKDAVAYVR